MKYQGSEETKFPKKNNSTKILIKMNYVCFEPSSTIIQVKIESSVYHIDVGEDIFINAFFVRFAGGGETRVSAKCSMSLNGHLLISPPCFSFIRFIVEQCLLKKTSI